MNKENISRRAYSEICRRAGIDPKSYPYKEMKDTEFFKTHADVYEGL